jgi:hypothetical protein
MVRWRCDACDVTACPACAAAAGRCCAEGHKMARNWSEQFVKAMCERVAAPDTAEQGS